MPQNRPVVTERNYYAKHQSYLNRISKRAEPYLHFIVEEIEIIDNTYNNYCLNFCKEWIKNTPEPLDNWEWDQDEMELNIIFGDNIEIYSAVELGMDEE